MTEEYENPWEAIRDLAELQKKILGKIAAALEGFKIELESLAIRVNELEKIGNQPVSRKIRMAEQHFTDAMEQLSNRQYGDRFDLLPIEARAVVAEIRACHYELAHSTRKEPINDCERTEQEDRPAEKGL